MPTPVIKSGLYTLFALLMGLACAQAADPPDAEAVAQRWLASAAKVQTLAVQFAQERKLRTLNRLLVRQGKLWFQRPGSFRWQIDEPPSLIALKTANQPLQWISTKARTVRITATKPDGSAADPAMDILQSLLSANTAKFTEQFRVLSAKPADLPDAWDIELDPKDRRTSIAVKTIQLRVTPDTGALHHFSVFMRDGSVLTTRVLQADPGSPIAADIFTFDSSGYSTITE
ncbi:MAG: outer membrane lipoprotein carrier protein LolA [Verrucomicrobiales bacterium]|nr:outer membrane lipoprotein carrier protein LolA [Verrucomicrobiales bacterium]MCP5556915.1 outer membrane lipoprotein carrier protein LolA [Verrucomicrobiaceae bacterium]